ncbi:hypothetical protein [Desulfoplanes sp.]
MDNIDKLVLRHCFFPPGNAERLLGTAFTDREICGQMMPNEHTTLQLLLKMP